MRICVSSICYMRDLFPPECFRETNYGGTTIHQLISAEADPNVEEGFRMLDQKAFLLTQWLEQGNIDKLYMMYAYTPPSFIYTIYLLLSYIHM